MTDDEKIDSWLVKDSDVEFLIALQKRLEGDDAERLSSLLDDTERSIGYADERFECGREKGYEDASQEVAEEVQESWESLNLPAHQYPELVGFIKSVVDRTGPTAVECKEAMDEIMAKIKEMK